MLGNQKGYLPALLALVLTACGSGSGNGENEGSGGSGSDEGGDAALTAPSAPILTLTPNPIKSFFFSWSDVSDESEYRLLENPDGMSGYSEVAVLPENSARHTLEVSLPQRVNARYILQACNSQGCTDSKTVFVTGSLAEAIGYFKASNTEFADQFGAHVALSSDGKFLAVGAPWEESNATGINGDQSDNTRGSSGAVYVFTQNNDNSWIQQAYIKASNSGASDEFGSSLALSSDGSLLAVGAYREDSAATGINGIQNNTATNSGAVYVFSRNGSNWSQQADIKASNTGSDDEFGYSLALSSDGTLLAVGARREESAAMGINGDQANNTAADAGAVYLFSNSDGDWSQQAYIKASNTSATDRFGSSLALSSGGSVLAVGAVDEDSASTGINGDQSSNAAADSGAVYVFGNSNGIWSQIFYIKASNTEAGDSFGNTLALSSDGSTLAVGAYEEDSGATGIDGDQTSNVKDRSGAVYVFTQANEGSWSQQAYVKASNTENFNNFGRSLALSSDGRLLAVGATGEYGGSAGINGNQANFMAAIGAVYWFAQDADSWSQQAYIKASNPDWSDRFGSSLALSSDGRVLAVGANSESGGATGINGDQDDNSVASSGAVYLY